MNQAAKALQQAALVGLVRYPLKSGAGEALDAAAVHRRGLAEDRRWMVVNEAGQFLTARQHGALLEVHAEAGLKGALTLRAKGRASCSVPGLSASGPTRTVQVWKDACSALDLGAEAAQWMSEVVGQSCRVVYMPERVERPVSGAAAQPGDRVSFADGFPVLLTLQESLEQLNEGIQPPVPMRCFRPNLVVAGFEPYAEQAWSRVRVGSVDFEVAGPCVRCQLTTRHPQTGARREDGEPLRALALHQRQEEGVVFGINLIPRSTGRIRLGDLVEPMT